MLEHLTLHCRYSHEFNLNGCRYHVCVCVIVFSYPKSKTIQRHAYVNRERAKYLLEGARDKLSEI